VSPSRHSGVFSCSWVSCFSSMVLFLHSEMYVLCIVSCPPLNTLLLQILFISGLTLIIGPQKTFYFFARKQKMRGTVCFLGGILLVFLKWPFVGMVVETFGFLNLFGYDVVNLVYRFTLLIYTTGPFSDFFPVIITFLRQLPFVGTFLSLPYIRVVSPSLDLVIQILKTHGISGGGPTRWFTNICSMTLLSCAYGLSRNRRTCMEL
jgi:hypothetical protein